MKKALLAITFIFLTLTSCYGQQYFDLNYSNQPFSAVDYLQSFMNATGWLYSGEYNPPENCRNCNALDPGGRIKKEEMDSLHTEFLKICQIPLYSKLEDDGVPITYVYYYAKTPNKRDSVMPFILHTFYEIKGNKLKALFQTKITFSSKKHTNLHDVYDISFATGDGVEKINDNLVLKAYKKKLKEDQDSPPPSMKQLKK